MGYGYSLKLTRFNEKPIMGFLTLNIDISMVL